MIVNRDTDVILLHKCLDPRQGLGRRVAGNNYGNARSLAILELGVNVLIFILCEVDHPGSMEPDAGGGIVSQCFRLLWRVDRQ